MSCPHPDAGVRPDDSYCGRCGARLVVGPAEVEAAGRRPRVVALLCLVDLLLGGLCLYMLGWLLARALRQDADMALLALLPGLVAIAAGSCFWGMLKLRPWAQGLQMGLAGLLLLLFPLGTLLGTAALVYLLLPGMRILYSGKPTERLSPGEVQELERLPDAGRGLVRVIWALVVMGGMGAAVAGTVLILSRLSLLPGMSP